MFADPDNEGMVWQEKKWRIENFIKAAPDVNPDIMVATNARYYVPNADLNIHFGPKEPEKPYLDSEATPHTESGGYWGTYSKEECYYNYIRIGIYFILSIILMLFDRICKHISMLRRNLSGRIDMN